MKILSTAIEDVKIIEQFHADDARGVFVKTFHNSTLQENGIDFKLMESFYSISKKDVIRGMHFQHPPYHHAKIVFCTHGAIMDVALDIRKGSPTYGMYVTAELSLDNKRALYIPQGFAHGFRTLTDDALTFYFVSSENKKEADDGLLYNSFGLDWGIAEPIMSVRDLSFKKWEDFDSPFSMGSQL